MDDLIMWVGCIFVVWLLFKTMRSTSRTEKKVGKHCQNCGMKIPYKANVCPYCRSDPGTDWAAERKILFSAPAGKFAFGFLAVAVVLCFVLYFLNQYF